MPIIKSNEKLYEHICKKYPYIKYSRGEDLNIDNMKARYVKEMWTEVDRYPYVSDVAEAVGVSDRTVYRIAKQYKLISRHKLNK
jgi:NADH:ubiquinone oxidoreductase subunit E